MKGSLISMPILTEHKEILSSQSASKTLPEWYEFFNKQYSKNSIYEFCYTHNYAIKEERPKIQSVDNKKYNINQNFFKTWNRDMAYVLGLWFANGCIYGEKMFDITLHKKDKYILKKVAEKLGYQGSLYDYVDCQVSRINFSCVVIYNDIITLIKSDDTKFPDVPKDYLPDFIRGYFDGNGGCVMCLKNNRINSIFTSDSKSFLDSLLKILKEEAGIEGGSYDAYYLSYKFGKKDSLKIGEYMYKNNPELFLLRKRKKFIK